MTIKKILATLLALSMTLSLAACGGNSTQTGNTQPEQTEQTEEAPASSATVLTSIFAMAAHFVQENWILMIKTLFQRMLRSVMTNPHGVISIPQSVKISSTP